ncbi:MAG: methionyl-tRNA formyltransferase, partial [Alphaproteobacteria bacterium]|nr:methionyl-tRNA formyltransferase [Alphaproteobacteria bacterium]
MTLRLAFMGTPDFSVPTLAEIVNAGHEIATVYTQPPRAAGRGLAPRASPVQDFANSRGIEVRTPLSLRDETVWAEIAALELDAIIVVAYGLILPQKVLDAPRHGCLNLHASLLPRWRGAAPIQRAIMAGDTRSGVNVMHMDAGLDTGPVCLAKTVAIGPDTTAGELHDTLAAAGSHLMVQALTALEGGNLICAAQAAEGASYARKIDKSETRINWSRPATEVHNQIRGLAPFPGAWFEIPAKKGLARVKVLGSSLVSGSGEPGTVLSEKLDIACAEGAVRLTLVQRAGKAPTDGPAFARGAS